MKTVRDQLTKLGFQESFGNPFKKPESNTESKVKGLEFNKKKPIISFNNNRKKK